MTRKSKEEVMNRILEYLKRKSPHTASFSELLSKIKASKATLSTSIKILQTEGQIYRDIETREYGLTINGFETQRKLEAWRGLESVPSERFLMIHRKVVDSLINEAAKKTFTWTDRAKETIAPLFGINSKAMKRNLVMMEKNLIPFMMADLISASLRIQLNKKCPVEIDEEIYMNVWNLVKTILGKFHDVPEKISEVSVSLWFDFSLINGLAYLAHHYWEQKQKTIAYIESKEFEELMQKHFPGSKKGETVKWTYEDYLKMWSNEASKLCYLIFKEKIAEYTRPLE